MIWAKHGGFMTSDFNTLRQQLQGVDQAQVLRHFDRLDSSGKEKLTRQLAALDLDEIDELAEKHVRHKSTFALPSKIEPVKIYPRKPAPDQQKLYTDAAAR